MPGFSLLQHNGENYVVQFKLKKTPCVYVFMEVDFPKADQICPLASLFQIQSFQIKNKVFILSFSVPSHLAK